MQRIRNQKDIAIDQRNDLEMELQLQTNAMKAIKSESKINIPKHNRVSKKSLNDIIANYDINDIEINKKLERIGQNARIIEQDQLPITSSLSRPEQSEVDYYNLQLANASDAITDEQKIEDTELYLTKNILLKLRSLNISTAVVEEAEKALPNEIKEWLLNAWMSFKKQFVELYGHNPYGIKSTEIISLIQKLYFKYGNKQLDGKEQDVIDDLHTNDYKKALKQHIAKQPQVSNSSNELDVKNKEYAEVEMKLNDIISEYENQGYKVISNKRGTYQVQDQQGKMVSGAKQLNILVQQLKSLGQRILQLQTQSTITTSFNNNINDPDQVSEFIDMEGTGLKPLGNKKIHYHKMLKHNIIDIRHMQGSNIVGYPVHVVSDLFCNYVNNLIHGKMVSLEDIKNLNPTEQQLFRKLLLTTQVNGKLDDDDTIDYMKKRLQLIYDERNAGNDNNSLLTEAKMLLAKLKKRGIVDKKESNRWMNQLYKAIE